MARLSASRDHAYIDRDDPHRISPAAYAAIAATLPATSRSNRGERLTVITAYGSTARLSTDWRPKRRPLKSYSDVILRLAKG
jgi:hypothetical protein